MTAVVFSLDGLMSIEVMSSLHNKFFMLVCVYVNCVVPVCQ